MKHARINQEKSDVSEDGWVSLLWQTIVLVYSRTI